MRYADCEVLHALDGWVVDCQADSCALYATQVPKLDDAVALAEDHSCPITMEPKPSALPAPAKSEDRE